MLPLMRITVAGLATLASAVSITIATAGPAHAVEVESGCDSRYCWRQWVDESSGAVLDYAAVYWDRADGRPPHNLYSHNRDRAGLTLGVEIDPTDGGWGTYKRWDTVPDNNTAHWVERRTIRKFRFISVDTSTGRVTGSTAWRNPPGAVNPP